MELLECHSKEYDHIIYNDHGKVDVEAMIKSGWMFKTIVWTHENVFNYILSMIGDNEVIVLTKNTIRENNSVQSFNRVRGNILVSQIGYINYVEAYKKLLLSLDVASKQ